jgi:hypothetical protein
LHPIDFPDKYAIIPLYGSDTEQLVPILGGKRDKSKRKRGQIEKNKLLPTSLNSSAEYAIFLRETQRARNQTGRIPLSPAIFKLTLSCGIIQLIAYLIGQS